MNERSNQQMSKRATAEAHPGRSRAPLARRPPRGSPSPGRTHHDVQALVGGPLGHDVLDAGLVDVHGPPVLDHGAGDVEVLGAVHLEVAIEEVGAGLVCKG